MEKMKLCGSYSWKYINSKHVAIKVEKEADYARILVGENGMPVWFIEHHPMRVFKWTPDFDPFFETPITAVWCNIIGLPMHLFDEAALFLIGGLLGKPIQADFATANQSRLSFARICVEIDISQPVDEEVTVECMGKEATMKVKWDKIPLYCEDCKHVGHSNSMCYAFGKKDRPVRRNYHQSEHSGHRKNGQFRYQNTNTEEIDGGRSLNENHKEYEHTTGGARSEHTGDRLDRGHQQTYNGWESRQQSKKKGFTYKQGKKAQMNASELRTIAGPTPQSSRTGDHTSGHQHHAKQIHKKTEDTKQSNRSREKTTEVLGNFASPNIFNNLAMDMLDPDLADKDTHMEEDTLTRLHEKGKEKEQMATEMERSQSRKMEMDSNEGDSRGLSTSQNTPHV